MTPGGNNISAPTMNAADWRKGVCDKPDGLLCVVTCGKCRTRISRQKYAARLYAAVADDDDDAFERYIDESGARETAMVRLCELHMRNVWGINEPPPPEPVNVALPFHPDDHALLVSASRATGEPLAQFVRRACVHAAMGILNDQPRSNDQ